MRLRDLFRRSAPPPPPRLRFIGEQDGENERRLKDELRSLLEGEPHIARAYLARVELQSTPTPSVALCLVTNHGDDLRLLGRIDEIFKRLAPGKVFLDVAFLTEVQEAEVRRVCEPFFRRMT